MRKKLTRLSTKINQKNVNPMRSISTQTGFEDPILKVIVEKLNLPEKTNSGVSPVHTSEIDKNGRLNTGLHELNSIVGPLKEGPKVLSNLPLNYRNFIKPIANNEKANSTLHDNTNSDDLNQTELMKKQKDCLSNNSRNCERVKRVTQNQNKDKLIYRPGPKCSKLKSLTNCDLRIPLMLNNRNDDINKSFGSPLGFETQHPLQELLTQPPKPLSIPEVLSECLLEEFNSNDMCTQTDDSFNVEQDLINLVENNNASGNINDNNFLQDEQIPTYIVNENNDENNQINEAIIQDQIERNLNEDANVNTGNVSANNAKKQRKINFNFKTFTTTISTGSKDNDSSASSSSESETESFNDNPKYKKKKFIKIVAKTVHIHNHFYNK